MVRAAASNASTMNCFVEKERVTEIGHGCFSLSDFTFHFMHVVKIKILVLECKDLTLQGCTYSLC